LPGSDRSSTRTPGRAAAIAAVASVQPFATTVMSSFPGGKSASNASRQRPITGASLCAAMTTLVTD